VFIRIIGCGAKILISKQIFGFFATEPIFDSKASLIGIKEVPVVFVHQDLAVPTTLKPVVKETANLSTFGAKNGVELNNNSNENKSSKINSAPGFGLLGGLTCLYSRWKLRKK
jgi:hypothetical protein